MKFYKICLTNVHRVNAKSDVVYVGTAQSKPIIKYKISMKSGVENRLKNIMLYLM